MFFFMRVSAARTGFAKTAPCLFLSFCIDKRLGGSATCKMVEREELVPVKVTKNVTSMELDR